MTDASATSRFIKPSEGRKVRFPFSPKVLQAEGETVEWSAYWQRLLNDQDIEVVEGSPPSPPAPPARPGGKTGSGENQEG